MRFMNTDYKRASTYNVHSSSAYLNFKMYFNLQNHA